MNISELRTRWSDILDILERENRIAWIAFFDARLAKLDGSTLFLDFSDSRKFANNLEYSRTRVQHRIALQKAIHSVLGISLEIVDES